MNRVYVKTNDTEAVFQFTLLPFKLKCKKPILIHLLHKILISLQIVKARGREIAKQEFVIYFLVRITWQHFRLLCSFRRSN